MGSMDALLSSFVSQHRMKLAGKLFFLNDPATPEIYTSVHTLSLHDALPIYYYTDAIRYTQVRVLEIAAAVQSSAHLHSHGDVLVRSQVVGFKKIKFFTNENIGDGKLELPENEMHTTSYWITLERPLLESLPFSVSERQSGMFGLLHALESVATLLLMCDRRD